MTKPTPFGKWKASVLDNVPNEHKERVQESFSKYYFNVKNYCLAKAGRASEEIIQKFQDRIDEAKAVIGEFDPNYRHFNEMLEKEEDNE
jgi:hypothetical protein